MELDGTIAIDDPGAPDVRQLLETHLAFGHAHSPPEDVHALDSDALADPAVTFLSCRVDGELVAIGALKELGDGHGELKSLHTRLEARGRGVGRAMVEHLVDLARSRGLTWLGLETGTPEVFAAARALYGSVGFSPCAPFGDYRESVHSIFMSLELVPPPDRLQRFPEQGVTDRAALDALLDCQWVGVLSCVADGRPLAVPMLYARDGDRVLLHGSTGAGALREVAAGAPAVLTVVALDALVVAPTTFESSVNYRSATLRGPLTVISDDDREASLDRFAELIVPGRTAEVRPSNRRELAATLALALPITEDAWLLKVADGWPATPEEAGADPGVWSGLVPVRSVLGPAVPAPWSVDLEVPRSVTGLTRPT